MCHLILALPLPALPLLWLLPLGMGERVEVVGHRGITLLVRRRDGACD